MKCFRLNLWILAAFGLGFGQPVAAIGGAPPDVTVDLRDGSRIVGQSVEGRLKFHSNLFGDFKLNVADVRTIDCFLTNSATLTTTAGDTLVVSFSEPDMLLKTSFGRVELPVRSIRALTVAGQPFEARLAGLVALWSGANEGKDLVGANNTLWTDVSYAGDEFGRAFSLNGFSSCARVPVSPVLDVGQGKGMTLSAWIDPYNVSGLHPIMEWEKSSKAGLQIGVQLWIGQDPSSHGVLCATFVDPNGSNFIQVASPPMTLVPGVWQHVAVTYDRAGGLITLYLNGRQINQSLWGSFVPLTEDTLWISRRPRDHPGDWTYNAFFRGLLDQVAIFNRALSADEIKSIFVNDNGNGMVSPNREAAPVGTQEIRSYYDYPDSPPQPMYRRNLQGIP